MKDKLKNYIPKPLGQKRKYSVLLPLVKVSGKWHVLYQIRSEMIPQPGEVAFPGGRVEAGESCREAAIRETCEELLLSPDKIDIFGEIDYLVHQNRTIHCFVGQLHIDDWQTIQPNHSEVARLFTVPLALLMQKSPTYYSLNLYLDDEQDFPFERIRKGVNYPFMEYNRTIPFYDIADETIWGMTALFTHRLTEILKEEK